MAAKNFWRNVARQKQVENESPDERKKQTDRQWIEAILWLLGSGILLLLYAIAVYSGAAVLDFSSTVILLIVGIFFIYSWFHLKEASNLRDKVYQDLPARLRSSRKLGGWKFR